MTLTQVSTWFANARRRLKKENKMTWSPRNRSEDDADDDLDNEEEEDDLLRKNDCIVDKKESSNKIEDSSKGNLKFTLKFICFKKGTTFFLINGENTKKN